MFAGTTHYSLPRLDPTFCHAVTLQAVSRVTRLDLHEWAVERCHSDREARRNRWFVGRGPRGVFVCHSEAVP